MKMQKKIWHSQQAKTPFAVCLSLFSVLLIYFAPLFSQIAQALPEKTVTTSSIRSTHTMVMSKHDHAKMSHHTQESNIKQTLHQQTIETHTLHSGHHGHHAEGEVTDLLEACGYCALLFHLNWLEAKTFDIIPIKPTHYTSSVFATASRKYYLSFPSILPRAPPQLTS
jgi:hypothetical protein